MLDFTNNYFSQCIQTKKYDIYVQKLRISIIEDALIIIIYEIEHNLIANVRSYTTPRIELAHPLITYFIYSF